MKVKIIKNCKHRLLFNLTPPRRGCVETDTLPIYQCVRCHETFISKPKEYVAIVPILHDVGILIRKFVKRV